jgi:hypothetical protein
MFGGTMNLRLKQLALALCVLNIVTATQLVAQTSAITSAASTGLVSQLTKELSISPTQAKGGAGTLFALAKTRLTEDEFSKVSSAVPSMSRLLKAAPPLGQQSEFSSLESSLPGSLGSMGRMAEAAEAFHKLGLSPEMAVKFLPVMSKYVESKGGSETAGLLEKALK